MAKKPVVRKLFKPSKEREQQEHLASLDTVKTPVLAADVEPTDDVSLVETLQITISPAPSISPIPPAISGPPAPLSRTTPPEKKRRRKLSTRAKIVSLVLLLAILTPLFLSIGEGMQIYSLYTYAHDGVQHLLTVKDVFTGLKTHPTGFLDQTKLHRAQQEFTASYDDFRQLQTALNQDRFIGTFGSAFPEQLSSAHALSQIGVDVAEMGQELTHTASLLAPSLQGSLLTDTGKPLVTPVTITLIHSTIEYLLPHLDDIQRQSRLLSLAVLPVSDQQRQEFTQLLQAIPQAQADLTQADNLLAAASWLLGVDSPRTLLVQTMDRAELRPTGGFTGQFGELLIHSGRIAPFSLKNIGPYEESNLASPVNGQLAPLVYRSWWPIPNWGLRDSNLSADFPTSAKIAIDAYQHEFGHHVDGVILFSPFLIGRVLQVTGPITLSAYHETITAQNLEARLHYYQLDNVAIRKEEIIEHVEDPVLARKLFTADLARLLMDKARHAPPDELITIARAMLHALKTKDLQVYVTNQQIEDLLIHYGAAAQMDRSNAHDGLYVVQANVSASKASQYVRTTLHDVVTLNAQGGATHLLQIRLNYNQIGPVYGLDTYRDYIRVYVPERSDFLWGDGFDSGKPLCGSPYYACSRYDVYGNGDLLCPAGLADAGAATSMIGDPYIGRYHPLDSVGAPTNMSSDEVGRAMFAGWVVVPKNCVMTVTLSWYVPPLGTGAYTLHVQRQSSTFPELDLTILPTPGNCGKLTFAGKHFDGVMGGEDMTFSAKRLHPVVHVGGNCYPDIKL